MYNSQFIKYFALLCSASFLLIFFGIGWRFPWPADEPRFALIAKEMVETGQWFFPTRGGELYPDKPPILMWTIAFFYLLTNNLKVAFILPSALAGLITIWLTYDLGKRLWNRETGLLAGLLLLFTIQFLLQAKTAQIDALVCAFITIGCYGMLRFLLIDGNWRWYYTSFFFMGIGVITKGVGFLPVLMLIPYCIYVFRIKDTGVIKQATKKRWLTGPAFMLLAISIWLLPMLLLVWINGDSSLYEYRDNILFKQTITRYTDAWHHVKPWYYFITSVIPIFWLPLSFLIPWLLPYWIRSIKSNDARIFLPFCWIILVLLFFSFSSGKRGVYILPALPMLALISAPFIYDIISRKKLAVNVLLVVSISLCAMLFITGILGLTGLKPVVELFKRYDIQPWWFFIFTSSTAILLKVLLIKLTKKKWLAWPTFFTVTWLMYSSWGYSLMDPVRTPILIFEEISKNLPASTEIALVDFSEQFILFSPYKTTHFGYQTPLDEQWRMAYEWLNGHDDRRILVDTKHISEECFFAKPFIDLGFAHRRNWVLLSVENLSATCTEPLDSTNQFTVQLSKIW